MEDICAEYEGIERRKHCELVVILKTQFEEEKKNRDQFREAMIDNMKELKTSLKPLDEMLVSYNRGKWFMGITVVAAIGAIVTLITKLIAKHIL